MAAVSITSANLISPLGWTPGENFTALLEHRHGFTMVDERRFSAGLLPLALLPWKEIVHRFADFADPHAFTRFEQLALLSARAALAEAGKTGKAGSEPAGSRTALVLSTTKGNVELLEDDGGFPPERLRPGHSAGVISGALGIPGRPTVVSNACISGVVALILARRMLLENRVDRVVVVGADVVSPFIVSGFESFKSLSSSPCRPFDARRDGLSLGEAAATLVLEREGGEIQLCGGATTNDANHISGPSRTGEGLLLAVERTLEGERPDVISAHGTATLYNDEMESIALSRAGMEGIPVNSLKGVFGHTLGAAGVLETILTAEAMKLSVFPGTMGYGECGVSGNIRISDRAVPGEIRSALKTASGFGGCNAALLLKRK